MSSTTLRLVDGGTRLVMGSEASEAARQKALATEMAAAAALSAASAEAAAGPTYASTAAGLAATPSGEAFAVDNGDGTVTIYLDNAGVAVAQRTLATTAYLASSAGAGAVGFIQSGTGAVARTAQDKMRDTVGAKDHGALWNDSNDDTAELQATINSLEASFLGGEIELPSGSTAIVSEAGTSGTCLNITKPVSLVGKGGVYTAIRPAAGVASDVAAITYNSSDAECWFTRFQNFYIGNPLLGSRTGGIGLRILTNNPGISTGRLLVEGVGVAPGSDVGLSHENDDAANITGGLYMSEFRRNLFHGGMRFGAADSSNGTGDSLLFTTNTCTGPGYGVEFTGTIDADGNMPSQAVFINHNSTSEDGAFLFHRARFPTVLNGNIEQTVVNTGGVMVSFLGDAKPNNSTGVWAPVLQNTLLAAFPGADLATIAKFGSCSGGYVWNSAFLDGGGGSGTDADVVIDSGSHDVWVGPNLSNRADLLITDNGVGTRGVTKTAPLANSWIDPGNGDAPLYFWKDIDGAVHIAGGCKNGATAGGTVIATLPVGFRPAEIEYFIAPCRDNGGFTVPATLTVQTNGNIQISYCPTTGGANAQTIWPKVVFRAAHANTIRIPVPYVV